MKIPKGLNEHRFKENPDEKKFAETWRRHQEQGRVLAHLLDSREVHSGSPPMPSDRDFAVAATVVQWLGSPVGKLFLEEVGFVDKKKLLEELKAQEKKKR